MEVAQQGVLERERERGREGERRREGERGGERYLFRTMEHDVMSFLLSGEAGFSSMQHSKWVWRIATLAQASPKTIQKSSQPINMVAMLGFAMLSIFPFFHNISDS
jgi:hypothetical protein